MARAGQAPIPGQRQQRTRVAPHLLYVAPRTRTQVKVSVSGDGVEIRSRDTHDTHLKTSLFSDENRNECCLPVLGGGRVAGNEAGTVPTAVSVTRQQYSLGKN